MNLRILPLGIIGLLALSITSCRPKTAPVKPEDEAKIEDTAPTEEPSLRGKDYQDVADIMPVYFELDQATLRSDARDTLAKNYQSLKSHPEWEVLIEGHTDERGTTEYNLGLGQKRAAAVRKYYMTLGVKGSKIATISYGKEKPVCMEQNDSCYSQNRRGVSKVRARDSQ